MTAQKSWRRLLATATVGLLAASGIALAPIAANAADVPTLNGVATETANEKVDFAVTGSGYESVQALPGQPGPSVYVTIVEKGVDLATVEQSAPASSLPVTNGAISGTLTVPAANLDQTKSYELITWPTRSVPSEQNVFARTDAAINWAALFPVTPPTLTVTPATGLDAAGATVTVTGTGYNPAQPIYVFLCGDTALPADLWTLAAGCRDGAKVIYASTETNASRVKFTAEGTFETTFAVKQLNGGATSVYTAANHTAPADRSQDAKAVLGFAAPEPQAPSPTANATVTNATATGLTVKFDLANIDSTTGAYISVFENGTLTSLGHESLGVATDWLTPGKFSNGAATGTLTLPKAKLDRTKTYQFAAWKAHTNPTEATVYTLGTLQVTAGQWDAVFADPTTPTNPTPTFTDVKKGDKFAKEITWMASEGISTGVKQADGTYQYQPKNNVTREAMAAFLFRQYGNANYKAPTTSYFSDIKPGDKFYKEISWMYANKVSTGVKQPSGKPAYQAKSGITREAMAAFMYRLDKNTKPATPKSSPFSDVKTSDKFYKEIAWMSTSGLSTGIKQPSGKPAYASKSNVTREAMAAFLYRADK